VKPAPTDADVRAALRLRFAAPEFAALEEVGSSRRIDMLVMSLWKSRGLELMGVEIKVSRRDLLRELKNPKKAEAIQNYCDRWWLAVSHAKLVQPGDLPPTWGLLALQGKRMICVVEAPALPAPKALDRVFLAAILRRTHEAERRLVVEAKAEGFERGIDEGPEEVQKRVARAERHHQDLKDSVEAFEKASGVEIGRWPAYRMEQIGDVVKKLMAARARGWAGVNAKEELERAAGALEHAAKRLRRKLEENTEEDQIVAEWTAAQESS
jgi:hypothetical protein